MMYDLARSAPPPGSPLESLFILVWWMRQDLHYYGVRVAVQAMIDPDKGKAAEDAWKEFTDYFYPFLKGQRKRHDKMAIGALMKEVKRGFLSVRPLAPLVKSKLGRRVREYDTDMSSLRQREDPDGDGGQ